MSLLGEWIVVCRDPRLIYQRESANLNKLSNEPRLKRKSAVRLLSSGQVLSVYVRVCA